MIGIIDVGGGLRAAYGCGVLDYCMENGIVFDYGIGVSAGSGNILNYMARQYKRTYQFYTDYIFRKEYFGLSVYKNTGSFVGLDYIYSELSNSGGENPLDWKTVENDPAPLVVVATDALTGKAVYFTKDDMGQDHYDVFKASSNLPLVDRPYMINGVPYYDGGIVDPIPFEKAFADGCDRVVMILSRPKDYRRSGKKDAVFAKLMQGKYPKTAEAIINRAAVYNEQLDRAVELEKEGKLLILAPDSIENMSVLKKDESAIRKLYVKGFIDAAKIRAFMEKCDAE